MATDSGKRYNSVLDIIEKRLIPDEEAKKARGEVFTPLNLVREMLFGLRKSALDTFKGAIPDIKSKGYNKLIWGIDDEGNFKDDDETDRVGGIPLEVFRDAESTWLDPANGIGNFPVVLFYMLDYQLNKHGKKKEFRGDDNTKRRREHIVKNMLFMIELNKGNVNTSKKIFNLIVPGVPPNVCCANSLEMTDTKLKDVFGIDRFDVVMGNPPFNEGGTKHHKDRGYYTRFIMFGFKLLNKNGYLVYIHPPNYHRIDKDDPDNDDPEKRIVVKQLFNENNLLFLRIISDTKKLFDVQIAIDYYILQNKNNESEASVLDKHNILTNSIDISKFTSVPNFGFNIIKKLEQLQKTKSGFKAKIGRDSEKHSTREALFKNGTYPIVHLINEDGIRIKLATTPHKEQKTPKVIVNGLGVPYVLDDLKGKYGVAETPNYILEPSANEKIFLFSRLFQYLNWAYRIQGNKNDRYLFEVLPDLNKFDFKDEEAMLKSLGINKNDEKEINKYKVPVFPLIDKIEKAGEGKAPKTKKAKSAIPPSAKSKRAPRRKGGGHKTRRQR